MNHQKHNNNGLNKEQILEEYRKELRKDLHKNCISDPRVYGFSSMREMIKDQERREKKTSAIEKIKDLFS